MKTRFFLALILSVLVLPDLAGAYVGPGTGLSAIGAFFALIFAVIVSILGFFWYPVKRLLKKKRQEPDQMNGEK